MFIRFKKRKLADRGKQRVRYSYHAVLVENSRENDRVRQRIVSYLGAVPEESLRDNKAALQVLTAMNRKIQALRLPAQKSEKLRMQLARYVARKISKR